MTARQVYEAILLELNKNFGTPDLLLEDFNHFINKAIYAWVQKRYNVYDTNQQTTDDVQVLKKSQYINVPENFLPQPVPIGGIYDYDYTTENPTPITAEEAMEPTKVQVSTKGKNLYFTAELDDSYLHMLNCILEYKLKHQFKCYDQDEVFMVPAKRLTSDQESIVINNAWLRPTYRMPYYKVETSGWSKNEEGEIQVLKGSTPGSKVTVTFGADTYYKLQGKVKKDGIFQLVGIHCDFVKFPEPIRLTYTQLDELKDESDVMEFKEDVCHEIIKEAVKLIAFNTANPLVQGYEQVNMTVPPQGGMQQQQAQ